MRFNQSRREGDAARNDQRRHKPKARPGEDSRIRISGNNARAGVEKFLSSRQPNILPQPSPAIELGKRKYDPQMISFQRLRKATFIADIETSWIPKYLLYKKCGSAHSPSINSSINY
jgi:hypothetical protein